jgi:GH24 family phage-related lysozyme (muramidase)
LHHYAVRHRIDFKAMKILPDLITITKPFNKHITQGDTIEADKIVRSLVRDDLYPNQFTALVSFVLTTPRGTLARSILLHLVNSGELFPVDAAFTRYGPKSGKGSVKTKALRLRQANLYKFSLVANNVEARDGR